MNQAGPAKLSLYVQFVYKCHNTTHALIFTDFFCRYLEQEIFERASEIHREPSCVWIGFTFM